jgi:hypothetical protein
MQHNFYEIPKEYAQQHKFFEKYLTNDLDKLSDFLHQKYSEIENAELLGISKVNSNGQEYWLESGSVSTVKWREYNVFQFYNEEIYNVFLAIKETMIEACEYYGIDFNKQKYMVQGWFNINHNKTGKLDWHDHGGPWAPHFHGYYCVKAEPSSTFYKIDNKDHQVFENKNIDNRLIISEMGHPHAQGNWDWDGPRITLAYDIVPLSSLISSKAQEQHWIPLI